MKALIRRLRRYVADHRSRPRPADHFSLAMESLTWGGPTS